MLSDAEPLLIYWQLGTVTIKRGKFAGRNFKLVNANTACNRCVIQPECIANGNMCPLREIGISCTADPNIYFHFEDADHAAQ